MENKTSNRVDLKIIEGGAHGFSKKYDAMAIQYVKDFAITIIPQHKQS